VLTDGRLPITLVFDCVGPMAKSVCDLVNLAGVLRERDCGLVLTQSWQGVSVGFVDLEFVQPASFRLAET
jgi:hypothetical protein